MSTLSQAAALEELAKELSFKAEHLEPGPYGDSPECWDNYPEREREYFRQLVKWILLRPDLLAAASPSLRLLESQQRR